MVDRPDPDEDLPLVRELPRRADPGRAGARRIAHISQTVGFVWTAFWWFLAPGGDARWYVGAAGLAVVAAVRVLLHTKGAEQLDVSHLRLELATPQVRRGGRASVTLSVIQPERVRGRIDVAVACVESYAYRADSDRSGPSRRTRHVTLWEWPVALEPRPSQQIAFDLPPQLPFSWDGDLVRYTWTVTATERVESGLDPTIELELTVLP